MNPGSNTGSNSGAAGGAGGPGQSGPMPCFSGQDSDCPTGFWCQMEVCVATSKGKTGDQCRTGTDCAGNMCLFRTGRNDATGFCSKVCMSFSECPTFWSCGSVNNASANYCIPQ